MKFDPVRIAAIFLAVVGCGIFAAVAPDPFSFSLGTAYGLLVAFAYLMLSLR